MNEDSSKRANGHLYVPNHVTVDGPPEPLHDVVSPVQGGSVLEMQTGLFIHGRNRALQSGTVESCPEDTETLAQHARAMARMTFLDKYDPSTNAHDAMRDVEYQRLLAHRGDAEMTEQHAAANLRDAEIALARTTAGPKPQAHPMLVAAFTSTIVVSLAPTVHDLFAINDDLLAWFLATLSSVLVGFMVTWAILSGRRSKWEWIGVVAGIALGIGLCIIRLSATSEGGGAGIAVGLTAIEVSTVLLVEWVASGLRTRDAEWLPKHAAEVQAIAARDAALAELSRSKSKANELREAIAATIALVEDRHNRNIHLPELEAVAIKATLDGYRDGLTQNIGRLRGVRTRTE